MENIVEHLGAVLTVSTVAFLSISIFLATKIKSTRGMFYIGLVLIISGVILSASSYELVDMIFNNTDQKSYTMRCSLLSNLYLVIAAIGANFLSNSIIKENEEKK